MLKAFFTSATGMRAQETLIDNTANNLANVNTTGFKKDQVQFADLMYDISKMPGAATSQNEIAPIGLHIGNGVHAVGTATNYRQGTFIDSQPTHMAIQGDGFFQVLLSDQTFAYTRDGSFQPNSQGQLTTAQGHVLQPPIQIPENAVSVSISPTGVVQAVDDQGVTQDVGFIQLTRFVNPAGLQKIGNNLLKETAASGLANQGITPGLQGTGTVLSGKLEGSNVEVVNELVSLITAQRAYEINSRAIRAGDEMLSTTSQIVR